MNKIVSSTPSSLNIRWYKDDVIFHEITVPPSYWWVSKSETPGFARVHIDGTDDEYFINEDELWGDEPTIRIFIN